MSMSKSPSCPFQAKDNLWYPSYREKVTANIKHNNKILEKLGLDKFRNNTPNKKQRSPAKKRKPQAPLAPTRQSKRIRKAPPELGEEQTSLRALENLEDRTQTKKTVRKHTVSKKYETLTSAELEKLKKHFDEEQKSNKGYDDEWMEEMNNWLLKVPHGMNDVKKTVSTANARTVMRQVRKLVLDAKEGNGIDYKHWNARLSFCWWKPVPPDPEDDDTGSASKSDNKPKQHIFTCDLQEIHDLAQQMEDTHGKDRGNGWLLLHPIRKMQLFQEYYFRKHVAKKSP